MTDYTPAQQDDEAPATGENRSRFQSGAQAASARGAGAGRRGGFGGRPGGRRKICPFCQDNIEQVDYKDVQRLRRFLAERAKIEPRRKFGTCARHQRQVTTAIKRARHVALLPFVSTNARS